MIKYLIAVCFSISFLSGYYICYIRNFKNTKSDIQKNELDLLTKKEEKIEIPEDNRPPRIILKQRIVGKRIVRERKTTQTADELMAKMNARHRAILSGDYSAIESTWKLNSY